MRRHRESLLPATPWIRGSTRSRDCFRCIITYALIHPMREFRVRLSSQIQKISELPTGSKKKNMNTCAWRARALPCVDREIDKYNLQMRFDRKKKDTRRYFRASETHVAHEIIVPANNTVIASAELHDVNDLWQICHCHVKKKSWFLSRLEQSSNDQPKFGRTTLNSEMNCLITRNVCMYSCVLTLDCFAVSSK